MKYRITIEYIDDFEMDANDVRDFLASAEMAIPPSKSELIEMIKELFDSDRGAITDFDDAINSTHIEVEILDHSDTDELTENEADLEIEDEEEDEHESETNRDLSRPD